MLFCRTVLAGRLLALRCLAAPVFQLQQRPVKIAGKSIIDVQMCAESMKQNTAMLQYVSHYYGHKLLLNQLTLTHKHSLIKLFSFSAVCLVLP